MQLQGICGFRGILRAEQPLEIAEERFTGQMAAEQLLLQRTPRPVGKDRALQVEHAFVQIGHGREDPHLHSFARVAHRTRVLHRRLQGTAHLSAKAL